jgi:hypothetical protein
MDQVVHDRIGWFEKLGRLRARRPPTSSNWTRGALCATATLFIVAGSARGQLLMSDNFDEVGNTNGAAPVGWTLSLPSSTQATIVNGQQ